MQLGDDVGPGLDQDLVAALEVRAAEVVGGPRPELEVRAGGAVEDDDALAQRLQVVAGGGVEAAEQFGAGQFGGVSHGHPRIPGLPCPTLPRRYHPP